MNRETQFLYEDSKGNEVTLDIIYEVEPYKLAKYLDPTEGGDIDIRSITLNGVEYEVSESTINAIREHIKESDDYSDKEYFYDEEDE